VRCIVDGHFLRAFGTPDVRNVTSFASRSPVGAAPAGQLSFTCYVPGHYDAGMHAPIAVTPVPDPSCRCVADRRGFATVTGRLATFL
jgi:hypothetical protein